MKFAAIFLGLAACVSAGSACRRHQPEQPPVATPSVKLNHERAPLGSPLDITYKFVVADNAKFDGDYRVMVHVSDADEVMIWNDDHNPPIPTREWKPGQTIEYTRTIFVPVYPYVGEASVQVGLYSTRTEKRLPLTGENIGQNSYRVSRLQLQPQTENLPFVLKDGWHPTEIAEHNATVQWNWTKKDATIAFRNPKKDSVFYLDLDNPGSVLKESQHVVVTLNDETADDFVLEPQKPLLRRIPLKADQLGASEMAELKITVDKTYVPALLPAANSRDPRELGVRVFHAFVDPR